MGHKLTSLFGNLFHSKDNESPNMQDAIEMDKHDSIIAKLKVINENIEVSRAILTEEIEHYSAEQRKGLQEYIQKDVAKTGEHITTMMQSLLQYIDILKKRLYQHHLFNNDAYYYADELYNLTFQSCLWIPKSDALISQSQKQYTQHSEALKKLLVEMKQVIHQNQEQPLLIKANRNYEWLLKRKGEIEENIRLNDIQLSEQEVKCQLKAIKERLHEIEPISEKIQEIDLALLEAVYRNGRRFLETLYVQNTLNTLRSELKSNLV